jgi:pyruvate,water dikinase
MSAPASWTRDFSQIGIKDLAQVGGKNASLGELFNHFSTKGIGVLDGFATTAAAFRQFLEQLNLETKLQRIFTDLDVENVEKLAAAGLAARSVVMETPLPRELCDAVLEAYEQLMIRSGGQVDVAVRSSATAEDLPEASFAGAAETFLNVRGASALIEAVHRCFASLYTDRAIGYRARMGFGQMQVALSAGVMPMVRSDKGSAGVMFTLDPESGFRDVVVIDSSWGLGEYVVKGAVTPDEWTVFKPSLRRKVFPVIGRRMGSKETRLVYGAGGATQNEATPESDRRRFSLSDDDVQELARWACTIESHYSEVAGKPQPMDIEWAKDGLSGKLFIVQARPETVHATRKREAAADVYRLRGETGPALVTGQAVGERVGSGPVRVVLKPEDLAQVQEGEVLVAAKTDPDWEPVMRRASAIVTDQGGRTAHAAIVSREFGLPCVVGTGNGTAVLKTGQDATVSCAEGIEGRVYGGRIPFDIEHVPLTDIPDTRTHILLTVGDPATAFKVAALPNAGVGLARTEFIITHDIGIHPMALVRYPNLKDRAAAKEIEKRLEGKSPRQYFIERFSEGVARIAAAFYPKPVLVRTSDFKTNEYAALLGGREFEPAEENPMLGFRGASRYYDPAYADGFALECEALHRVRQEMGFTNVKIMIPFCRTVEEGRRVIAEMAKHGLRQGEHALQIFVMCELPSNVILAREFLEVFDGFSIGSNDLTQLILGLDRDSGTVARLFDERNDAVRRAIADAIAAAHRADKHIGICGQAPSDYPDFAEWLVQQGIDSISLNPDAAIRGCLLVAKAEAAENNLKVRATTNS